MLDTVRPMPSPTRLWGARVPRTSTDSLYSLGSKLRTEVAEYKHGVLSVKRGKGAYGLSGHCARRRDASFSGISSTCVADPA